MRRRWGEGRELVQPEDVSMLVLMILTVTKMLGLTDFFLYRTDYQAEKLNGLNAVCLPLLENQPEIPFGLFPLPSMQLTSSASYDVF